ncbi:hypothetical protein F3Y22_tig00110187pilonHSYRG00165 [Hibiscus syriacus]|uniref:Uncharacterized protein n=1 Tax=Hibiscus syriacus TaxID=106335 RepID=A0A6A3BHE2_HIBSY|nr:hypothetical protein F3Y22_tig00110187pilonHSYRG00165 [Hibiscus syriacus]
MLYPPFNYHYQCHIIVKAARLKHIQNEPLLTSPSTPGALNLHNKIFAMDNTDVDNVKPTEECHEVHNVNESDRLVGQLFCSRDQAWHFYKRFAREHGFSARKGTIRLDVEGDVKTQEFCCSKEGFRVSKVNTVDRQRAHTPVTRTGSVSKADIDEATTLKEVGVGTSQVMNYLTQQAGGYHNVGFTHKDLYNALQREAMMNKSPISVVTDGDRAMQRAIKSVIPYAKHRLCSWHLSRNAQANIGDPKFTAAFSKCMASWWTTKEFDIQWRSIVSEFNVHKHPWVIEKGNTRHLWAQAYLTGHFFANIRSTQSGLLKFHTKPFQITKLVDLESHAAAIFTRESFRLFQDELIRETLYRIEAEIKSLSDECQHYILSKTVGLPCRHQLHILKQLDYTYLPGTLIQSRWTNDAKASAPSYVDLNVSPEVMQMARFAALRSTSSRLCYIASKTDESFKTARDEMKKLIEELENSFGLNHSVNQSIVVNNVRDPQRKQRKRKKCRRTRSRRKLAMWVLQR